jgi:hypothetical protein
MPMAAFSGMPSSAAPTSTARPLTVACRGRVIAGPHLIILRNCSSGGREAVCYCAHMSWILPTPLLLFAGIVALWPLATLVRRPTSAPRLVAEAFVSTLAVIGAFRLAWVALWLIEQRW